MIQDRLDLYDHLLYLQAHSFKVIVAFVAVIGYLWMLFTLWPMHGRATPVEAWFGSSLLLGCVAISSSIHKKYPRSASMILIAGSIIAIECGAVAYRAFDLNYLLVLPVIFASVLVNRRTVLLTGISANTLMLFLSHEAVWDTDSQRWWVTLSIIMVVMISSLLSVRNLYTALAWALSNYDRAVQNELIAREHQAELKQALKSLDTLTYNLERTNHMLTFARNQAEESRRLKQQFAQNISHELRTPLNLIVGFTEAMIQSPEYYGSQLPPAYLRELSIVHRNAMHLQSLVDDVLDLSRIEAAQMTLVMVPTPLNTLIHEVVNTARSLVETRGLEFYTEIADDLPTLSLDPTRIRQVIFNLLNNAARFTPEGSITVKAYQSETEAIVAIADTGIGIPSEELTHIFETFHQVDGSAQRRHGGAGLGLAISKQFVELHGGRMRVESTLGVGSTFYFSLPLQTSGMSITPSISNLGTPNAGMIDRLVIAVTRSPSAATMLTRYIRNCRTVVVENLSLLQRYAQNTPPQLVIIDTHAEDFDPAQMSEIVEAWGWTNTPFIACPLPGEDQLRRHLSTIGYLIKPVTRQNLWDVLRGLGDAIDHILVIDDDRDFVRLMNRMLDNPVRRYRVTNAYSGQEGLAMMRHHMPDLVLMDLGLPDMDGLQVLEMIRQDTRICDIPVIIVSARDEMDMLETLHGPMLIYKFTGLTRMEIVRWVQDVLETITQQYALMDNTNTL